VAEEPVLNVSERGDRAYIGVAQGQPLDHAWSGNVVDLCPVGALLSKDFLHKARAWDLDKTASICPGCTQGCNVQLETRDGQVVRVRPRPNMDVNRYFMCDEGRLGYQWLNRADRLDVPMMRDGAGKLAPTGWEQALARAAELAGGASGAVGLVSAGASCEALEEAAKLLKALGGRGAFRVRTGDERPLAGIPDLALRAERAPNVHGALEAGFTRDWDGTLSAARSAPLVLVLDDPLDGVEAAGRSLVYIGTALPDAARAHAAVVLPCANMAEEDGTFRNIQGRVQAYSQAKPAPGMARPAAWILAELSERLAAVGARA